MLSFLVASAVAASPACTLPFEAVPTKEAAISIAKVVIAANPNGPGPMAPYELFADYIETRGVWLVFEKKRGALGGGGLAMWISKCDGTVSEVRAQR